MHSTFKILVSTLHNPVCNIFQGFELSQLLKQDNLIIWDKAPMTHKYYFEALEKTLNHIMNTENETMTIFGGKFIVFGKDFRQILIVILGGTRSDIVHVTINSSYL